VEREVKRYRARRASVLGGEGGEGEEGEEGEEQYVKRIN
jgi:hypothetical protein